MKVVSEARILETAGPESWRTRRDSAKQVGNAGAKRGQNL